MDADEYCSFYSYCYTVMPIMFLTHSVNLRFNFFSIYICSALEVNFRSQISQQENKFRSQRLFVDVFYDHMVS